MRNPYAGLISGKLGWTKPFANAGDIMRIGLPSASFLRPRTRLMFTPDRFRTTLLSRATKSWGVPHPTASDELPDPCRISAGVQLPATGRDVP